MSYYKIIFCGLYAYLLDVENSGEPKVSKYYAMSSIFALSVLELFGFLAISLFIGESLYSIFRDRLFGVYLAFFFVFINGFLFLYLSPFTQYIETILFDKEKLKSVKKNTAIFCSAVVFMFFTSIVYRVSTF